MGIAVLAAEALERDIWYPTILGFLVVAFAVILFCGSLYLLLATNLGARLGFLVAFTALMGFMVILTSLWVTTASPLNTLKGRIPAWEPLEIVSSPEEARTEAVRSIETEGRKVSTVEAVNIKAAVDENLVQVEALPGEEQSDEEAARAARFALFGDVTEYQVLNTYELGGSKPNPLDFELTHTPLYSVIEFCEVIDPTSLVPFGVAPPEPTCDESSENRGFLVMERDLGSLRVPPIVAWIGSVLLFVLGLLALHWRERDEQAAAKRAAGTEVAKTPAPAPAAT